MARSASNASRLSLPQLLDGTVSGTPQALDGCIREPNVYRQRDSERERTRTL